MASKAVGAYSFRMYRLWVCLPATETVAIAAAARLPKYWVFEWTRPSKTRRRPKPALKVKLQ